MPPGVLRRSVSVGEHRRARPPMFDETRLTELRRIASGWLRFAKLVLTVVGLLVALLTGTPTV